MKEDDNDPNYDRGLLPESFKTSVVVKSTDVSGKLRPMGAAGP